MKTTKKYIRVHHAAVEIDGIPIIESTRQINVKAIQTGVIKLSPIDRVCGRQEFADITGLTFIMAGKMYKPSRKKKKTPTAAKVYDLRKDKS